MPKPSAASGRVGGNADPGDLRLGPERRRRWRRRPETTTRLDHDGAQTSTVTPNSVVISRDRDSRTSVRRSNADWRSASRPALYAIAPTTIDETTLVTSNIRSIFDWMPSRSRRRRRGDLTTSDGAGVPGVARRCARQRPRLGRLRLDRGAPRREFKSRKWSAGAPFSAVKRSRLARQAGGSAAEVGLAGGVNRQRRDRPRPAQRGDATTRRRLPGSGTGVVRSTRNSRAVPPW